MLLDSFFRYLDSHGPRTRARRRAARAMLLLERLEDRALPSFITAPTYAVDVQPYSVAAGDFDGDRDLDLATANFLPATVSVLLNNGNGTFQPRRDYASGYGLRSLVAADFNRDGALDLAAVYGQVYLLLGNGDGSFQPPRTFSTGGGGGNGMAVGDFNRDGRHDLAVTLSSTVSVLLGNGNGTFGAPQSFGAGRNHHAVAVGDFNDDGQDDLVTTNINPDDYSVSVLLGNGDGTFGAVRSFAVGNDPRSVAVGEFNGDDRPDLAAANRESGNVSVLLGRGDGTFQTRVNYAVGFNPLYVTVGDWDGDGDGDLAAANFRSNTVSILLGQGNGTFQAGGTFAVGALPIEVAVGDLDGDGDLDLAVADSALFGGGSPDDVAVLLGYGDGTFAAPRSYAVGMTAFAVAVGDFNEDGVSDLAVANYHGDNVSVLLGRGDGTFHTAVHYAIGASPTSVVVGDFDRDGHQDLAVTGNRLDVSLGRGDGTFGPTTFYLTVAGPRIAAADFNGDGALDLAVAAGSIVRVLLGRGDGTFQAPRTFAAGYEANRIAVGDLNRDGRMDIVMSNSYAPYKVTVLLGDGNGSFQAPVHYGDPTLRTDVAVGDFNGDGALDLAVANETVPYGTVSVLLGNGDGTFQAARDFPTGWGWSWSVAVSDFNGDGILDLALTTAAGFPNAADTVSVLLGRGDGTFLAPARYHAGITTRHVAVGDLNGDSWPDLVVTNDRANTVTVLLNAADDAAFFYLDAAAAVLAGQPFDLTVYALSGTWQRLAYGYRGTVAFWSSDAAATLPAPHTFRPADGGIASFPGGVTLRTPGTQYLAAFDLATFTVIGYAVVDVLGQGSPGTFDFTLAQVGLDFVTWTRPRKIISFAN